MTQVQNNTAKASNTTRNERRRQKAADRKASKVTSIETISGTIDASAEIEKVNSGDTVQVTGTVDSNGTMIEGTTSAVVVETKDGEKSTGDRGKTTKFIWDMMSREEGCTRAQIIDGLKEMFPGKTEAAIKNTVGALMHVLPKNYGYRVIKTQIDEKDKRKMNFKVEKIEEAAPAEQKAA